MNHRNGHSSRNGFFGLLSVLGVAALVVAARASSDSTSARGREVDIRCAEIDAAARKVNILCN